MTVQIYTYYDASAPALSPDPGSLLGLLDQCLVSGYGSKAGLGWTKDFHDTVNHKAIFSRTSALASLPSLLIENNAAVSGANVGGAGKANNAVARMVIDVTDVDTWTGLGNGNWVYAVDQSTVTGTRQWFLIGDELGFYLSLDPLVANPSNPSWQLYHFGDMISRMPADQFNCWLGAGGVVTANQISTFTCAIAARACQLPTNNDGSLAVGGIAGNLHGSPFAVTNAVFGTGAGTYPDPVSGDLRVDPVYLRQSNGIRGQARGLFEPALQILPADHAALMFVEETWVNYAGKLILLPVRSGATIGAAAFQVSGSWPNT